MGYMCAQSYDNAIVFTLTGALCCGSVKFPIVYIHMLSVALTWVRGELISIGVCEQMRVHRASGKT